MWVRATGNQNHFKTDRKIHVITKLTSSSELTLHVNLEAPAEAESASAKIEDIKSALRELGLGEDVNG